MDLNIDQLLLDSKNPRIGSASSQRDALQKILIDQEDKLAELADSIVEDGMSPIERLMVRRENPRSRRYVVVEGNRRTAALKILSNPAVLASLTLGEALQKRLERLANNFTSSSVEPISCYEVKKDDEALKWIYLRHNGQNNGKGVVPWSGIAAARFRGTDPALQALEFVKLHGNLNQHHMALLGDSFPITTLDRLLSTKEVRRMIGVDVKDRKLRSKLAGNELIKPLRQIVLDLAEKKINVSSLKNREAQVQYIQSFNPNGRPDFSKATQERDIDDFKNGEFNVAPSKGSPAKSRKYDPSERNSVIPRTLRLNISVSKVAEIYKELRALRIDDNPHACAVLLRVFLELSIDFHLKKNQIATHGTHNGHPFDKKLDDKMREAVTTLVEKKGSNPRDFAGVSRALRDADSPLYIKLLHGYVHSQFVTPKPRDLRAAWDEAQPFFEAIWA